LRADLLLIVNRERADPFHQQAVIKREEFQAYDTTHAQSGCLIVRQGNITQPRAMARSCDHGENRVTTDIKAAITEDQGWMSFRSRFITKRERNNHEIPLLTGHRTPPRPPW